MQDDDVKAVLVEVLLIDDDEYLDHIGPDDVEAWDSIGTVEIALAVEARSGWRMAPEDMVRIRSIGDLKDLLRRHGVLA